MTQFDDMKETLSDADQKIAQAAEVLRVLELAGEDVAESRKKLTEVADKVYKYQDAITQVELER